MFLPFSEPINRAQREEKSVMGAYENFMKLLDWEYENGLCGSTAGKVGFRIGKICGIWESFDAMCYIGIITEEQFTDLAKKARRYRDELRKLQEDLMYVDR